LVIKYRIKIVSPKTVFIGTVWFSATESIEMLQFGPDYAMAESEDSVEYSLQDLKKIVASASNSDA